MSEKKNLTKRIIDALPTPAEGRQTYQDTADNYLHLVLTPTARTWRYVRKVSGRVVFLTLGRYPNMTPEQARQASRQTSADYSTGKDPQQAKRESKQVATWADLFAWYMENHAKPHKRTWKGDEGQERLFCSGWGTRAWQTITTDHIGRWHKQIGVKHGKFAADRALALVRCVFNKAMMADLIRCDRNPAKGITMFHASTATYSRDRFLQADELKRLFDALDAFPDQNLADFFRLAMFTGARRANVQGMRWTDFDRKRAVWIIPAAESKNKEPMRVLLLQPAVEILNRRWESVFRKGDEWVFPSKRVTAKTPHLTEPKTAWKKICTTAKIEGVRIHDLRRTLGSWQAMTGASLSIIGKSLGHRSSTATAIYARLSDDPVRESMGKAITAMLTAGNGGKSNEG